MINQGLVLSDIPETYVENPKEMPVSVVGFLGTNATAVAGELKLVRTNTDVESLGTDGKLVTAVKVLRRYGCDRLIVLPVTKDGGVTPDDDLIVDALPILQEAQGALGYAPLAILIPGNSSDVVIDEALVVGAALGAAIYINVTDTVNNVEAARDLATGIGTKNTRLVVSFGEWKNAITPTILEETATHVVGVRVSQANTQLSPMGAKILGVSEPNQNLFLSFTDETADSEKLTNVGVISYNRRITIAGEQSWIIWGYSNASKSAPDDNELSTFISYTQAVDETLRVAETTAQPFIGQNSNLPTAYLIEQEIRSAIAMKSLLLVPSVEFKNNQSNLNLGQLTYAIQGQLYLPIGLITINLNLKVKLNN